MLKKVSVCPVAASPITGVDSVSPIVPEPFASGTNVDDGYSGTNFDRPGFQAMLAEIEAGRVAVCCTKDLSRLGRNSSLTGLYINFTFPKYNVRYIAINDHFDTIDPNSTDSDIAGIKNWFNDNLT